MKKTYINPTLEIVTIHTQGILAASVPPLSGEYGGSDPVLSPDNEYDDYDFDDFE